MPGFLDDEKLNIECPQCGGKLSKSVRDLKRSDVKCPKCGVRFETSQFKKELDKVDRQLKDFQRNLKNIKIDIKL